MVADLPKSIHCSRAKRAGFELGASGWNSVLLEVRLLLALCPVDPRLSACSSCTWSSPQQVTPEPLREGFLFYLFVSLKVPLPALDTAQCSLSVCRDRG